MARTLYMAVILTSRPPLSTEASPDGISSHRTSPETRVRTHSRRQLRLVTALTMLYRDCCLLGLPARSRGTFTDHPDRRSTLAGCEAKPGATGGGRVWWAHFAFTRINIAPTIL